ncbi:hypothetical protein QF027_008132 [Streptomyces canus]|nr:hypothetical protein [Streptomyces canus]
MEHYAVAMLAELRWYGKKFTSADDVEPVICYDENGELFANNEAVKGAASLWMVEFGAR